MIKIKFILAVTALLLAGCASPFSSPSRLVQKTSVHTQSPPPGKSLVLIHRPRNQQGYGLYTGVWDGKQLIADLGNGHSVAYVCEPGKHYFINRSAERVGVVEAELLPDKTYCLWLNIAGTFVASFQIEPVKPGDKAWKKIEVCEKENIWVERANVPAVTDYQQTWQKEIDLIIQDFVNGTKRDRLRHLGENDFIK